MFTIIKDGKIEKQNATLHEAAIAICRFRNRVKLTYPKDESKGIPSN